MPKRRILNEDKPKRKSGFQPGNTHGYGARGYDRERRLTGRFITQGFVDYLSKLDPKTGRQRLGHVFASWYAAIKRGDVAAIREALTRIEGQPIQGIAIANMTPHYKEITREMTDLEAAKIYTGMMRGIVDDPSILEEEFDAEGNLVESTKRLPPPPPPPPTVEPLSRRAYSKDDEEPEDEQPRFSDGGRKRSRYAGALANPRLKGR